MIETEHITYKVKEVPIKRLVGQTIKEEFQVFIVRTVTTDSGNTVSIPSAFSSFVQDSGNAYNTKLKHARYVCDFLNYVLTETYEDNVIERLISQNYFKLDKNLFCIKKINSYQDDEVTGNLKVEKIVIQDIDYR